MSCYIDLVDISQYVVGLEGRGFKQNLKIQDLSLKPGSYVSTGVPAGYEFMLYGNLWSETTRAALRTLIDTFSQYFRPREQPYRINFNGRIHYAYVIDLLIKEDEVYKLATWEAHFVSQEPVAAGAASTLTLAQDTIVEFMNTGVGITMPVFYKYTNNNAITFEMSDLDGAAVAYLDSTLEAGDTNVYGTSAEEYEYKLTDAVRCLKWSSGASHSGSQGGISFMCEAGPFDLSAENCYTLWVAMLVDKSTITSAKIGFFDGAHTGWVTITDRITDGIWSWVPVFMREAKKAEADLDLSAIARVHLVVTPDSNDNTFFYADGQVIVRAPAKFDMATTAYAGFYDMRTGKFKDETTGQEVNPILTIQGHPWVRPGCNLFYQNDSADNQYAYVRSAV